VLILDDYSRIIVAGHFMDSDSTYNNMLVIREAIEKYGLFSLFYIDNDSKFTEIHRALLELGIVLLPHEKDVAQAKGKIERIFRFIQERFILEHTATTLEELDQQFQKWIEWYNTCHINRDTGVVPRARLQPSVTKLLPYGLNLDDAFCFKEERKVAKDTSPVVPSLLQDKRCHSSFSTTD
jgi:transposase InsO family protein